MSPLGSLQIAARALRVNKLRSALTVLGIVVGVAAVVCMVSVGAGAQAEVSEKIRTLGANLLLVMPGARNSGGARLESGTQPTLTEEDAAAIRARRSDVQVAAPLLSRSMPLVAGNRELDDAGRGNQRRLSGGARMADPQRPILYQRRDRIRRQSCDRRLCHHRRTVRRACGNRRDVPDRQRSFHRHRRAGQKGARCGRSQSRRCRVHSACPPRKAACMGAVRGTNREALDFIVYQGVGWDAISEVESEIEALLRQRHHIRRDAPNDFRIENPADVLTARGATVQILGILLIAVASVSLIVGGISIMNIMLVSVTERTREIGLRMAIGATRRDIRWQFLIEALTLALVGGLVGALLGATAAVAIAWEAGWPILISPWAIILACGFAAFVGIVFGLYPARRAARLDPIVALRFE